MNRLSIGEFARASGLTPKALRLYDELDLLVPAAVDPYSGYRSYDPAQLERAGLIAALRGLGMPLARIREVCALTPPAAGVEVQSWWRGVEADVLARRRQAALLVDALCAEAPWGKDPTMTRPTPARSTPARSTTTRTVLDTAARCHRGLVRTADDDRAYAGIHLFAVADGLGEPPAELSASAAAMSALAGFDGVDPDGADRVVDDDPVVVLADGFAAAGRAVAELAGAGATSCATTGTTLTAMLWRGTRFGVAHLGDSRLLRLRGDDLSTITHDHTYPQSLVDEGRLTPDEAAAHPERARLVRALRGSGSEAGVDAPDLHLRDADPGDRYVLCTDGLHAVVDPGCLAAVLTAPANASDTADALIDAALAVGAPDNVACVVVDVTVELGDG